MRRWIESLRFRIRAVLGRNRMERELAEELDFHLEMEIRKNLARGMSPAEARRNAHLRFGGADRMRERTRASWGVPLLHDLQDDTRFALRQLAKYPAFGLLAVLTLGLGIGGTVALSSVVHGLLIRPLPYQDDQELVSFWSEYNWRGVEYDFVREVTQAYEDVAAYSTLGGSFRAGDRTIVLNTGAVSANLFDVLGARPLLGRTFRPGEDRPGAEPGLVLGHAFWTQEMGADPEVVGQRVMYDGTPFTVLGVMPEGFFFPAPEIQAWEALKLDPDSPGYQNGWLVLIARVRDGLTPDQVRSDVDRLAGALGDRFEYPDAWDKTRGAFVQPLRESLLGNVRPALLLLLGAVSVLLLMACANVAALLLTRTADRAGEIAVRSILGAGRGRLARQVLTESLVLAVLGGLVGAGLARAFFDVVVAMLPLQAGFSQTLGLDWAGMGIALVLATAVGSLISLAPIRAVLRGNLEGGGSRARSESGGGATVSRLQGTLVLAEALLCVMLVSGAALLVRSVSHLRALDPGLDPAGVLAVNVLPPEAESLPEERGRFFDALLERVQGMPGVTAAGYTNRLPVRDGGYQGSVSVEDRPDLDGAQRPSSMYRTATPGTFEALGLGIVQGRGFGPEDRVGAPRVAVVNQTFARRMWPGTDPLGRRISTGFEGKRDEWIAVVGVVEDYRVHRMVGEMPMVLLRPEHQRADRTGGMLVVRVDGDPLALAGPIRAAAAELDNRVALAQFTTMDDVVDDALSEPLRLRFFLTLLGVLGLTLGSVGIYGVVSYSVRRRRSEFGIRLALGADPRCLVSAILLRGLTPVILGIAAGVAASLAFSRVVAGFLHGVAPTDPVSFLAAAGVLLMAAILAAAAPAFDASRVEPAEALRSD